MDNTAEFWKLPPIEKIPEAYGAIADGRVTMKDSSAEVVSSDGSKTYHVRWKDGIYTSDDNGSRWQGYSGYPILAVLLLQGSLPLDRPVMEAFRGVPWKELNKKYKNKYAEALAAVLENIRSAGGDPERIRQEMQTVYSALEALKLPRRRGASAGGKRRSRNRSRFPLFRWNRRMRLLCWIAAARRNIPFFLRNPVPCMWTGPFSALTFSGMRSGTRFLRSIANRGSARRDTMSNR